jgi:transcription antitermination factor NusA-like protein
VRRLFELEVPEIYDGNVELKAVAREPGYRSKVAVTAKQGGLDAVGSCVGLRGVRIQNVVNELNGERIDVIQWDPEPRVFIANALSPAQVLSVATSEPDNTAIVVVPDGQLSLAIGKEGQNARLAARITGWRIDIKSATAAESDRAAQEAEKAAAVEEAVAVVGGEFYDWPLEQVGLSSRTFNLLLGNGITKVGEILDKSDADLLSLKGLGKKSLAEIRERLAVLSAPPVGAGVEEVEMNHRWRRFRLLPRASRKSRSWLGRRSRRRRPRKK